MNYSSVFLLCILFCAVQAQLTALNFTIGDELSYSLTAILDTKGYDTTSATRTGGSFGNMTSTVVIQCTDEDDYSYLFVMNMWNTAVNVGQTDELSSEEPKLLGDWLGDDMYFQQNKTGEIVQIWYQDGDSPYFIEVKVGAINAFQTHIVPPSTTAVYLESDPVGTHTSNFQAIGGESETLLVTKTFNQNDITSFPDPNVHSSNILLSAQTATTIHPEGYILSSGVSQSINLVSIAPYNGDSSSSIYEDQDATSVATNVQFSSVGSLDIEYSGDSISESTFKTGFTMKQLKSSDYLNGTLFEVTHSVMKMKRHLNKHSYGGYRGNMHGHHGDFAHFVSEFIVATDEKVLSRMYNRMARALKRDSDNLEIFSSRMEPLLGDAKLRNRYFTVLAKIAHKKGEKLVLQYLNSQVENIQVEMLRHLQFMKRPSFTIIKELTKLIEVTSSVGVKQAAFVALGSMARRTHKGSEFIVEYLLKSLESEEDPRILTYIIHGIGNAGSSVESPEYVQRYLTHENRLVKKAAKMTLEKFNVPISWETSNFPFNKTYNYDATLGGSTVSADFDIELFAGSNFDCKETTFNYEALASATATVDMWSYNKQAFIAEVVYGQANNQIVGDEILVQLFDDVIYHQALPTIDCNQHTYEVYQTAPGFSLSYTIWAGVIPIVFTASADLNFELSWGYDVCVNQLYAMVELVPQATVVVSGDAVVDLLIIQAGVELDGSFNTQLDPQLYVEGTQCEVGIDVDRVSQPMNIDFTAYYAWKECKYWIFDCHWGQHNQDTLFSWDYPSVNEVIYNQDWPISV